MSDKIRPSHLARKAVLYVRQSSAYQVTHNLESQRLQYAVRDRLAQLGWGDIDVVDEDLGRSAAGLVTRSGFDRMVAEVCLGKVGAVAAREVSRFARHSREWQQLVEVCRVVDTVLIDTAGRLHIDDELMVELEQIALAVDNLETVLKAADMTLANVVRLNIYTTDVDALLPHYGVLASRLGAAGVQPAATLLGVARLFEPTIMVEL